MKENSSEHTAMRRSEGVRQTRPTGRARSCQRHGAAGSPGTSRLRRTLCATSMHSRQATAQMPSAQRQPSTCSICGLTSAASTPPSGTPVCLIENTSDMRWAGVLRISR